MKKTAAHALYTVFEVHPASGRPSRVLGQSRTYEGGCRIADESFQQHTMVVKGNVNDVTYIDAEGFWQWKPA